MKSIVCFIAISFLTLLPFNTTATTTWLTPEQYQLTLFDFYIENNQALLESVNVLEHQNRLLLPYQTLASALALNVTYHNETATLFGTINGVKKQISLADNRRLSSQLSNYVAWFNNELYVDMSALANFIDANIQYDLTTKAITIHSQSGGFPFQIDSAENDIVVTQPYQSFTPLQGLAYIKGTTNNSDTGHEINLQTHNDLLFHSAVFNYSHDVKDNDNLRLRLDRKAISPEQKIFGFLNQYSLGDVEAYNLRAGNQISGVGTTLANYDTKYTSVNNTITLAEDAPANWLAELYHNGFYISSTQTSETGRVIFDKVNTHYGLNRFEIRLTGPYGEKQIIARDITTHRPNFAVSEFLFNAGLIDTSKSLLNQNHVFADDASTMGGFFETKYGLTANTSLDIALYSQEHQNADSSSEAVFSINQYFDNAHLDSSLFVQSDDGIKFRASIQGTWSPQHRYFVSLFTDNDYQSAEEQSGYRASIYSRFDNFGFKLTGSSLVNDGSHWQQVGDIQRDQIDAEILTRYKHFNFNNRIRYQYTDFNDLGQAFYNDVAITSHLSPNLNWRSEFRFTVEDANSSTIELSEIDTHFNWQFAPKWHLQSNLNVSGKENYKFANHLRYQFNDFNIIAGLGYSDDEKFQAMLGVSFNIGFDTKRQFKTHSQYQAPRSTFDIFSYIDNNQNAIYDEYDQPLPKVVYGNRPNWLGASSDQFGTAFLPKLTNGEYESLNYSTQQTRSPALAAVHDGIRFYGHKGGMQSLDLPFNYQHKLSGSISTLASSTVVTNVPVQLLNHKQQVIQETVSSLQTFNFEKVWPGQYTVRISPEYLAANNLFASPSTQQVSLNGSIAEFSLNPFELNNASENVALQTRTTDLELRQGEFYTVQFGAFNDRDYCILRVDELKRRGVDKAFYSLQTDSCKIMAGEFSSQEEAVRYRAQLPRDLVEDKFVTLYSEFDPTYSIQIAAYRIGTLNLTKQSCDLLLPRFYEILDLIYTLPRGNYCKVYVGDFLTRAAAQQILNKLPQKFKQEAFIVKR